MALKQALGNDTGASRWRGWIDLGIGLALTALGAISLAVSAGISSRPGIHILWYGPLPAGLIIAIRGIVRLVAADVAGSAFSRSWPGATSWWRTARSRGGSDGSPR